MSVKRNAFLTPYLFILPSLLLLLVFMYWPLIYNFVLSFHRWNFVSPVKEFRGWKNYNDLFTGDVFWHAVLNTLKYILGILPFTIFLPILFANLLSSIRQKGLKRVYETLMFLPTVISFAIASFVWIWMYNPLGGVVNRLLYLFGISAQISWLTDARLTAWSIVIVSGWRLLGYYLVLFTAALLAVPKEYLEAAIIDGANGWRSFWHIKWPLISPTTFFVLVTTVIFSSSQTFIPIHILTQGGPYYSSANLLYVVYEYGFKYFNIGLATAAAAVVFALFVLITVLQMKVVERFVHYGV